MVRYDFNAKKKLRFLLLGLSGWIFWVLYFAFYSLAKLTNYFLGTLCNLGMLSSSLLCKSDQIEADGGWAGVTPINPYLFIILFLVILIIIGFLKHRSGKSVDKVDYFDLVFKLVCIALLPLGVLYSFLYVTPLFIFSLFIRGVHLVYAKIRARKTARIINNRIQYVFALLLFIIFSKIENRVLFILNVNLDGIDKENYIDCCKNEVSIEDHIFKTKKEPPLCVYERNRQEKEICKLYNPIFRSILRGSMDRR